MKTKALISALILILVVLIIISGCATEKKALSGTEWDYVVLGDSRTAMTSYADYYAAYIEADLGVPADNREGYDLSSPVTEAATLMHPLLLAHGFMDDNVHFRGAVAFLDRAQKAGRLIEMDFYPRGAHGIGGKPEQQLLFRRMERFWHRHLMR